MKKRILFVDDEPNVLQGLRRMLRDMRHEWDMAFAENGQAALALLADSPFDVIVSDMRMPDLDGAQLLQEVKQHHPHMVRILLSGQSDQEEIMRSLGSTHRYLAKPCETQILRETIERACMLNTRLNDPGLIQIISRMESLPSLPSIYLEILEEMQKPESSLAKAGAIISKDMGMTAKILKVANSAFLGAHQHVSDPVQAATLMGLDLLKAMVLHIHVFEKYERQSLGRFSMEALATHSAITARYAQLIAKEASQNRQCIDEAMTAGLLHDVGKLVLAAKTPNQYGQVLDLEKESATAPWEAEHEVFGSTHSDIGGYLLSLWGLPDPVVEAVTFHHIPTRCGNGGFSPLTAVHVADTLARDGTLGEHSRLDKIYIEAIGLTAQIPLWETVCQLSG